MTERLTERHTGDAVEKPTEGRRATEEEVHFIKSALENTVIFHQFDEHIRDTVARAMFELKVPAGQKLILEGEMGSEMYLVNDGQFDVMENRSACSRTSAAPAHTAFFTRVSNLCPKP
jgi:cGMP-dependent protein kinase 2